MKYASNPLLISKSLLLLIVTVLLQSVANSYGQTAASYGYDASTATFVDISGTGTPIVQPVSGTPLGAIGVDLTVQNIPIGFTFNFCGAPYIQLSASNHGWVSLANSSSTSAANAAANIPSAGFLMPFWDDVRGTGSNFYYTTSGLAPNRVFIIQYTNVAAYMVSTSSVSKFQIRLYESTGFIEYCYGPGAIHSATASIGIANSPADYSVVSPGFVAASTTAFNTGITAPPANSVVLLWQPPCAVSPITGILKTCIGQTTTLTDAAASGVWSSDNAAIATIGSSSGIVTGIAAGTANVTYTTGGCTATAVVTVDAPPDAGDIRGATILCTNVGTRMNETAPGGKWTSSNMSVAIIDSNTGVVNTIAKGTAVISYKINTGGCTSFAVFTLTVVLPTFTISETVTGVKCYNANDGAIAVSVSGGKAPLEYRWSTGASTPAITGIGAGIYLITVKEDSSQCSITDSIELTNPDSLHIAIDRASDNCKSHSGRTHAVVSGGTEPYQYQWSGPNVSGAVTNELDSLFAGTYSLLVVDANGCKIGDSTDVTDICGEIDVSEGISPNGDGKNDKWMVLGLTPYPLNTVQVFDKWGNSVYEQADYQNDWSGKGKSGSLVPDGEYFYLVKLNAPNLNGGPNVYTGPLMIKR